MSDTVFFHSDSEIEAMVGRLEVCDFEKGEFTHAMHLAAAAWYLSRHSPEEQTVIWISLPQGLDNP